MAEAAPVQQTQAHLALSGVEAWYGPSQVLYGMEFDVRPGEVVTLLGRNGAGKTTTLRTIMGMVPRRRGSVRLDGQEMIDVPSHRIARSGAAFCPEDRGIYSTLSAEENLLLPPVVDKNGLSLDEVLELFPSLKGRMRSPGTKLSGGEQQMLAIGRILRTGSKLLLLDEPTEGLAPVIVQQIGAAIAKLKKQGFTLLMVEQNVRFASTVADRHYIVDRGRVVDCVDNDTLVNDFDRITRLLGV